MREEIRLEDEAEKLAERSEIIEFLTELGSMSKEKLIEFLMEKFGFSRDEAEKLVRNLIRIEKLRYDKAKKLYRFSEQNRVFIPKFHPTPKLKVPPRRKARASLHTVLKLPPDAHTLPCKDAEYDPYFDRNRRKVPENSGRLY